MRFFLTFYKGILVLIFLFLKIKIGNSQVRVSFFLIFNNYKVFDRYGKYNRFLDLIIYNLDFLKFFLKRISWSD